VVFCGVVTEAHDGARSYSVLEVRGRDVQVQLTVDLVEFLDIDTNRDGSVNDEELDGSISEVFDAVKRRLLVRDAGPPVSCILQRYELRHDHILQMQIVCAFAAPVRRVQLTSAMHRELSPHHRHVARLRMHGRERAALLDREQDTVVIEESDSTWSAVSGLGAVCCLIGLLWLRRSSKRSRS
jgi:hypothetical protein